MTSNLKIVDQELSKFKLEIHCEDETEVKHYLNASNYHGVLSDLKDTLRSLNKYGLPKDEENLIQYLYDKFFNLLDKWDVNLYE